MNVIKYFYLSAGLRIWKQFFFTQSVSASHNVATNGTFTFAIFFKKLLMIARNSLSAPSNIFYAMFYKTVDA